MNCPDLVMSAMSYHPRYRKGKFARAFWSFAADGQRENGDLRRRSGQWQMLEIASRIEFRSVRRILRKAIALAARRQGRDGGFDVRNSGRTACLVVPAYSRHQMLDALLSRLPYDPLPLVDRL